MAAPAAWPTVPPLQIVPPPLQLPLLEDVAPAAVWERRHVSNDGGPFVVVRVARTPDGAGWRASFGLVHTNAAGDDVAASEGAALDVDTYSAARAAADAFLLALSGAARAYARHVAAAAAAAAAVAPAPPVLSPRPRGRMLPFRTRRDELAPTG